MPLRTTMTICLQIMRISKKIMHLIQRMCQPEEFPPSMVAEGDDAPVEVDFTPKELLAV